MTNAEVVRAWIKACNEDDLELGLTVIDPEFDSTDVFIIVKTEIITEKYIRHYERGMREQEG